MTSGAVLQMTALTKKFPIRRRWRDVLSRPTRVQWATVLDAVTFSVQEGEFVGLLGPNGAGKTTLLKLISGLVSADAGRVVIAGHDVAQDFAGTRPLLASCLANERSLYLRLTGRENLAVAADLQGVPSGDAPRRIEEVLAAVRLDHEQDRYKMAGQYSSGMLQRLLIARALLTRPRVLLLDEPTRSLDPISARDFRRFLREELVVARGCAVVLATHNAEEAFDLCDRVAVMHHGHLLAVGPAHELASRYFGARFRVRAAGAVDDVLQLLVRESLIEVLAIVAVGGLQSGAHDVTLRLGSEGDAPGVLRRLVTSGLTISSFEPVAVNLAELVEGVVSADRREPGTA